MPLLADRPGQEEIPRPAPYPRSALHLCLALQQLRLSGRIEHAPGPGNQPTLPSSSCSGSFTVLAPRSGTFMARQARSNGKSLELRMTPDRRFISRAARVMLLWSSLSAKSVKVALINCRADLPEGKQSCCVECKAAYYCNRDCQVAN